MADATGEGARRRETRNSSVGQDRTSIRRVSGPACWVRGGTVRLGGTIHASESESGILWQLPRCPQVEPGDAEPRRDIERGGEPDRSHRRGRAPVSECRRSIPQPNGRDAMRRCNLDTVNRCGRVRRSPRARNPRATCRRGRCGRRRSCRTVGAGPYAVPRCQLVRGVAVGLPGHATASGIGATIGAAKAPSQDSSRLPRIGRN